MALSPLNTEASLLSHVGKRCSGYQHDRSSMSNPHGVVSTGCDPGSSRLMSSLLKALALASQFLQLPLHGRVLVLHPPPGECQTKAQEGNVLQLEHSLRATSLQRLSPFVYGLGLCHLHMQTCTYFHSEDYMGWMISLDTRLHNGREHLSSSLAH